MKSINLLKKIILKLDNKSLFTAVIFFIISLIQSLTDILLIVSLIPLLAKISDSSLSIGFERFIYIYWENFLGFFNISGVWFIAGITGLINAFIKMVAYYFGLKFALEATSVIAQKVFKSRIYRPFNQFINESISGFQAEITYIDLLETQIFRNFSRMINCVISLLIVSFGILLIDGKSFLTISLILLFIYLLISNVSSNAAYKFGTRKALQREGMFRLVNEIFSNIKSIILFDLRRLKLDKLTRKERKYRRACLWIILLSIQPRFLIEGISLFLICSWGAWLNYSSGFNQAILTVGTLIFAFKRLLPDMQQIYISYSQYKASKYVLDLILERLETKEREDFMLKDKINNYKHDVKIKLNLKNVGYECNFNEKNIQLLNSASIRIKNGDSLLITGKSGSGKSTLLNIISGLQKHTSGEIFAEIDNQEMNSLYNNNWRSLVSYTPQEIELVKGTIEDNIVYSENEYVDYKLLKKVCNICGIPLEDKRNGFCLSTIIGESSSLISGGQSQRVGIARGLYKKRPIIIFDESTSALDKESELEILLKIKKVYKNNIFIMVSHNTYLAENFSINLNMS